MKLPGTACTTVTVNCMLYIVTFIHLHVSKDQNTVYKEEHTVCTHTVGYAIVLLMTPILKYFFSALKNIHMSGNFQKCSFFALLI
jgi:hypothetical protein